ncbi:cold-shock protein [Nocardia jiangxiensis]|uniref:Cold-shock protein n=1 Tax=Nocardia jiangxiensis TaxID=282685 RepID=A0ABW6RS99_9NOCA
MNTTTIAWSNADHGYGFIACRAGERGVFLHFSGFVSRGACAPVVADAVVCDTGTGRRGPTAVNARSLAGPGREPRPFAACQRGW